MGTELSFVVALGGMSFEVSTGGGLVVGLGGVVEGEVVGDALGAVVGAVVGWVVEDEVVGLGGGCVSVVIVLEVMDVVSVVVAVAVV